MTQKRFIAGAVCPKCAAMDKIVMYQEQGRTLRECVKCGFRDEMQESPMQEIPTRVSAKPEAVKTDDEKPQPLKIYPSPKS